MSDQIWRWGESKGLSPRQYRGGAFGEAKKNVTSYQSLARTVPGTVLSVST